jgi:WD40 repeat protein
MSGAGRLAWLGLLVLALTAPGAGRGPGGGAPARTLKGHGSPVTALAFSADGKTLASGSSYDRQPGQRVQSGVVLLWDWQKGRTKQTLRAERTPNKLPFADVSSVAFAPDGKRLVVAGGVLYHGDVLLWDAGRARLLWAKTDVAPTDMIRAAFLPDGKTLVGMGGGGGRGRNGVQFRDARTGAVKASIPEAHPRGVDTFALSGDGKLLASASWSDPAVLLWDTGTRSLRRTLGKAGEGGGTRSLAFAADLTTLAAADVKGPVRLYDTRTGAVRRTLPVRGGPALSLAFSPDGALLAACLPEAVCVWDAKTGAMRKTWRRQKCFYGPVAFSPDGRVLAVGCPDGAVRLWEVGPGPAK